MASNNKPFLFYSNKCHHSARLINRIKPTNLVNNLNFICVDNPDLNIPTYITSVPTLYDQKIGRPITDNELFNWIEAVLGGNKNNNQRGMQQPQYQTQGYNQGYGQGGMQPQYQTQGYNQGYNQGGMQPQYQNQNQNQNQGYGQGGMNNPQKKMEELIKSDKNMLTMGNGNVNMGDITGDPDIFAFQPNEMLSGGAGTGYSFIDDGANETLNGNFIRLDEQGNEDIYKNENSHLMANITKANNAVPGQMNTGGANNFQQSATTMAYDKLLAERNSDMNNSMSAMRM